MTDRYRPRLLFALLCAIAVTACSRTPDEQLLRQHIADMATALEARRASAFLDYVSEDFVDQQGRDRNGLAGLVRLHMLRNRNIGVLITNTGVVLLGERATVTFNAGLTGASGMLPERAQFYAVTTGWRRESGEWRLLNAAWESKL